MAEYDKVSFLSGLASALSVKPLRTSNYKTDATNYSNELSTDRDKALSSSLNTLYTNSNDSAVLFNSNTSLNQGEPENK